MIAFSGLISHEAATSKSVDLDAFNFKAGGLNR